MYQSNRLIAKPRRTTEKKQTRALEQLEVEMINLASVPSPARHPPLRVPSQHLPVHWPVLDIERDQINATVWSYLTALAPAHVSGQLLGELAALSARIREGRFGAIRYKVIASRLDKIFSLGGDLELFLSLIKAGDRNQLFDYGKAAIDEVWANLTGCGRRDLTTIALVAGEAQGGGFEAALSCHVIVAERGTHFGFPESLFGLFPGMGAFSLLAARTDEAVAQRLISSANRYAAEFLHEIGIIDFLVAPGSGRDFVKSMTAAAPTELMKNKRSRLESVTFNALLSSVEQWVEVAMNLSEKHQRSMRYLLNAQRRVRWTRDELEPHHRAPVWVSH